VLVGCGIASLLAVNFNAEPSLLEAFQLLHLSTNAIE
jgi:hypothetical protein